MQTCFFCIFIKFIFFLVLLLFVFPYLTLINTVCFMNFLKRGTVLQIFHENPRVDVKILKTTSESWMQIYTYFEAENFASYRLLLPYYFFFIIKEDHRRKSTIHNCFAVKLGILAIANFNKY